MKNKSVIRAKLTILAILVFSAFTVASASPLPRAWMDQRSGYAIGGFDPVNYFVRHEALRPDTIIEAYWGGANWKFRNSGNKDAFLAHPHTYAPRFGGADPYSLAKRKAVQGNPALFDIYEDRLYFFYNMRNLFRWKRHRSAFIIHAKQFWPQAAGRMGLDATDITDPYEKKVTLDEPSLCEPARWLQIKATPKP